MPAAIKLRVVVLSAAVVAALAVIFYWVFLAPYNIEGTNKILIKAKTIALPVNGPESLDFDPQGEGPYVAVVDGRILKWRGEAIGWVEFAYTSPYRGNCSKTDVVPSCGRPLGLTFHKKTGELYICDGYIGLMKVGPEGGLAKLIVGEAEGRKVVFANQGDIDEEDEVFYFNDSSDTYHFGQVFVSSLSGKKTGRVIRYDIKKNESKVVMKGLRTNNGLALSKDKTFLVTGESPTGRIYRYWIKGPNAGSYDLFGQVPGYPDNIRVSPTGDFWVGIHCKKNLIGRLAVRYPMFGRLAMLLPSNFLVDLFNGFRPQGVSVKISGKTGEILEILEDPEGKTVKYVSEAYERDDGKIWFGSVFFPGVWVLDRKGV